MECAVNRPKGHQRSRSAVLKSLVSSPRKRSATKGDGSNPLSEIQQNRQSPSPRKSRDYASIHRDESPKKTKLMSTPFAAFSQKPDQAYFQSTGGKENASPPNSADSQAETPIWAQFASPGLNKEITAAIPPTYQSSPLKLASFEENLPLDSKSLRLSRDISGNLPNLGAQGRSDRYREESERDWDSRNAISTTQKTPIAAKRGSRVMAAVALFNGKPKEAELHKQPQKTSEDLDAEFEAVLVSRNVPEKQRHAMRCLDSRIKSDFVKHNRLEPATTETPAAPELTRTLSRGRSKSNSKPLPLNDHEEPGSPTKRSRSRGRTFTFSKKDSDSSKRQRSSSRPKSFTLHRNSSSTSVKSLGGDGANDSKEKVAIRAKPDEFVAYLKSSPRPQDVEIGKIHKLRLLLRNETVSWVDSFISRQGMAELLGLLDRIMQVEWREEHEDLLMHEVLLCLKGLCTTQIACEKLSSVAPTLFPSLLKMLFDEERKGPSEFNTRTIIIALLFGHLSSAVNTSRQPERAHEILAYLADPAPPEDAQPLPFIQQMHQRRPYQIWRREIVNVTKEVFWIFLHKMNTIPIPPVSQEAPVADYAARHYPLPLPPQPAAPYVGGVEWDATHYLAAHLELMNGLVASLPDKADRNQLRSELRASGFEECMGGALRTCKEKFYGCVHAGLKTWIGAAVEDGWDIQEVRFGPKQADGDSRHGGGSASGCFGSPKKSPKKGVAGAVMVDAAPPRLELPVLGFDNTQQDDGWL